MPPFGSMGDFWLIEYVEGVGLYTKMNLLVIEGHAVDALGVVLIVGPGVEFQYLAQKPQLVGIPLLGEFIGEYYLQPLEGMGVDEP